MSLQVVFTRVDAVRSRYTFEPGIFSNLILPSFFRKIIATEQKLPSVSTAKGTTMEYGGPPLTDARIFNFQGTTFVFSWLLGMVIVCDLF